jgi:hypothetical protein
MLDAISVDITLSFPYIIRRNFSCWVTFEESFLARVSVEVYVHYDCFLWIGNNTFVYSEVVIRKIFLKKEMGLGYWKWPSLEDWRQFNYVLIIQLNLNKSSA